MRPYLILMTSMLLSVGCPSDEPAATDDDDGSTTGGNTTDPTASATLPPTTDPTVDPTGASSSSGDATGEPTTGEPTTGEESSSSSGDPTTGEESSSSGDESSSSTGELCATLLCGDECVDPETNPNFCGATECEGENAGAVCSGSATCEAGECLETCDNCSFETGDFTDWTVVDLSEPFLAAAVVADGEDLEAFFGIATATDGASVAVNGFDGNGATGGFPISFGQDITLREGATTLEFDYRVAWDLLNEATATADRTFEVWIEPEGGGKPLETFVIETAAFDTVGDVSNAGTVDVSTYVGQTVFVNFVWTVPEDFSGPARAELDNIRVLAE